MSTVPAILHKAQQLLLTGRLAEAKRVLHQSARSAGADPDFNAALCYVHLELGEFEQAMYYGRRALAARNHEPEFVKNLARMFARARHPEEATVAFERVLSLSPDDAEAFVGLAGSALMAGSAKGFEEATRRGLSIHPHHPRLSQHHAAAVRKMGRLAEAYAITGAALEQNPGDAALAAETAFNSNYVSGISAEEILSAHQRYGEIVAGGVHRLGVPEPGPGDAERRLRLGIMSPDLRAHSCSHYAEPLMESLDRGSFELLVYFTHRDADAVTARFRGLADAWRDVADSSDQALARRIADDRVDVLIDLAGLTKHSRPGVLCMKPAPVVATYLGYPNTTGIGAVDYRIVDSITDPRGSADRLAVERLVRIDPCFLCYAPAREAPEVGALLASAPGRVTFGSFNAGMKFSDQCVAMWAHVLSALPESALLLKNFDLSLPDVREHLLSRFRSHGIGAERIEMLSFSPTVAEHLRLYHRVDIGLDTFPYHGTTTTCEAFHMGVPVVTLAGDVHAARVGCSLLCAVGLPELIARDEDEYVRIASGLASNLARLARIRSELRERQESGPLGDKAAFARRFGDAVRACWREECAAPRTVVPPGRRSV